MHPAPLPKNSWEDWLSRYKQFCWIPPLGSVLCQMKSPTVARLPAQYQWPSLPMSVPPVHQSLSTPLSCKNISSLRMKSSCNSDQISTSNALLSGCWQSSAASNQVAVVVLLKKRHPRPLSVASIQWSGQRLDPFSFYFETSPASHWVQTITAARKNKNILKIYTVIHPIHSVHSERKMSKDGSYIRGASFR